MAIITLKNWYQLDFAWKNPLKDLLEIASVMSLLRDEKLISKWFFLFEGGTIRVRMKGRDKEQLHQRLVAVSSKAGLQMDSGLPFSEYQEGDEMLYNTEVVEVFANIMSEVSALTIKKLKKEVSFHNYRILERLQHCMFNNMMALKLKPEEHFLQQRLLERIGKPFDNDFDL